MPTTYDVKLTYFKSSGKYYATGSLAMPDQRDWHMQRVCDLVVNLRQQGRLPGLADGAKDYHVLVECPEHPSGYPCLLLLEPK